MSKLQAPLVTANRVVRLATRLFVVVVGCAVAGVAVGTCINKYFPFPETVTTFEPQATSPDGALVVGVEVLDQGALGGSRHLVLRTAHGDARAVLINGVWASKFGASWSSDGVLRIDLNSEEARAGRDLGLDDSVQISGRTVNVAFVRNRPIYR